MSNSAKGIALVTGASAGIGAIYADRLARRGFDLILVARNRDRLGEHAKRLAQETGRSVEAVAADLTDPVECRRLARAMKHVRLVVDPGLGYGGAGPEHEDGPMQLVNGPVRTLMHGTGTVLFYDAETRELLGFLSPMMTVDDLLEQFVPALIGNARAASA